VSVDSGVHLPAAQADEALEHGPDLLDVREIIVRRALHDQDGFAFDPIWHVRKEWLSHD
jgi:hypothetical protein